MPTFTDLRNGFRLGPWEVLPDRGLLRDGEIEEHLEPKMVDVLLLLAAHQGQVVSKEQLIETVWDNRAQSDEPLNRCVYVLRKKLGDDSTNPTFVETIPRRGYRLKMAVTMPQPSQDDAPISRVPYWLTWGAGALGLVIVFVLVKSTVSPIPPEADPDTPMTSVAVFPFQCRGDTEKSLCFGFSEALTSTLLSAGGIKVVKKGTPFPEQGSHRDMASQLGVDGLLSGSVQRIGNDVIISAELIDGRNGFVVLSDRLEGSVEDIFRLQEQVATIVRQSFVDDPGHPLHAASEPSSFEAFEAYARGQYQFEIRDRDSNEESIDLFQQAIRLDPMFGPAYLGLAYAYLMLPTYDPSISADGMYELAAATTRSGIERDAGILEPAGAVFGFIHYKRGEWRLSTEAFETAVTAETVYPISHHWYSLLLASVGRLDDSLFHARSAYELDPDSAIIISRLAIANLWVGDMDQAGRYFGVVSKMNLESWVHDLAAGLYLIRSHQIADAITNTKSGLAKYGLRNDWVDVVYAGLENPELRPQSLELLSQLDAERAVPRFVLLTLWGLLGDADHAMKSALAIENIEQAFEIEILFIDGLQSLRDHEDFPLLLEKVGLPEYWDEAGCQWTNGGLQCT